MSLANVILGSRPDLIHLMNGNQVSVIDFSAYEKYVDRQLKMFSELSSSAIDPYDNESLGKVVNHIRQNGQREEAIAYISALSGSTDTLACQATLDLVARLMVMLELGCLEKVFGFVHQTGPRPLILWSEGTLTNLTAKQFPVSCYQDCNMMAIIPTFDAWGLENIAGIKIEFTDNLPDHLRLTNNNTQLYVFHQVAYLEQKRHSSASQNSLLPEGLAEETLRTLAIFFPQSDYCGSLRSTRKKRVWLERLYAHSTRTVDPQLTWCGTPSIEGRQLANFRYWKERLLIIKEEYDHSTPDSFAQWWHDRRNGVQWHNFWVAIVVLGLTAMFGLIQCILAAVQVYKAYHPS